MSSQSDAKAPVVFEVDMEPAEGHTARPDIPERFQKAQKVEFSKDELLMKQEQAEERRKAYEKARLDRIKERSEECHKINEKVENLMAQDAKRHGMPGTEDIKPMSTRAAVQTIKSLSKDFSKITTSINMEELPS